MLKVLNSTSFRRFTLDWCTTIVLLLYFFIIAERAGPFYRQFSLNDLTISHPFAYQERVSGVKCILIAVFVPIACFLSVIAYKHKSFAFQTKQVSLFQVSVLGLLLSLSIDGVVTDALKNWIGRPRPDFLARCGPRSDSPLDQLVDVSVCTAPLGKALLLDGMRSTPSGHASISFSLLMFLTLWLFGQFKAFKSQQPVLKACLCALPLLLASYIALSRVQDYRHHFVDITLGTIIGSSCAIAMYHKYFNPLWDTTCDKIVDDEEESILPQYTHP
ncbi:uncharacterized protein PRCAT00006108001 [Priceomyces carsonii]|uniref:uncharacterized protein n=1 Tax=Priceomyces carsonii TaxID=28549 RepID=UPI002EDA0135|nr:unnamed protein product [Priceomyces carsonii]